MINIEINDPRLLKKGISTLADFYHLLAKDEIKMPGLDCFYTGIHSSFFNIVIDTQESEAFANEEVVEKFFKNHDVPWSWFITLLSANNHLADNGFSLLEEYPSMYFDLSLPVPVSNLAFISVKEAQVENDLFDWIEAIREGFPSVDNCETYRKLNLKLLKTSTKQRHFILLHDNEIAAAATLFISQDSVMLHNLATKNAFRKLGFGTALTLHVMKEAQKLKLRHCFLDASEEAFALYKRLGFKTYSTTKVFCRS